VATATRARRRTKRTAPIEAEQVPAEATDTAEMADTASGDQPAEQADPGHPDHSAEAATVEADATDQQTPVSERAMLSVADLLAHPDNVRDEAKWSSALVRRGSRRGREGSGVVVGEAFE